MGLGFCAGYFLTLWRAKKRNVNPGEIAMLSFGIFLGALLGSRLGFLLQYPERFFGDFFLFLRLGEGGLTIWGGILGAMLAIWIFLRTAKLYENTKRINLPQPLLKEGENSLPLGRVREDFLKLADLFAPGAALGIAVGRIGCFLINDHAGAITKMPWGVFWPDGMLRHPVILYEIIFCLMVFFLLLWLEKHQKFQGQLFLNFLALYAAGRFALDFFRESAGALADPRLAGLTASQWICLWVIFGVAAFYFRAKKFSAEKKSPALE